MGELMAALVKYADSDGTKDPDSEDERSGKGKKSNGMKGQQYNPANQGSKGKRKADDFVANTCARSDNQRRKGPPAEGARFDLFRYRLVAQREVESMTIGGADPRS